MSHIVTGLDIGSSSVKCVVVERRRAPKGGASVKLLSAFSVPSKGVRKGIVVDGDELLPVIRGVMADVNHVSRRAADNVMLSVDGSHIRSRLSHAAVAVARADQEIQQDDIERVRQDAESMVKLPHNYRVLHNVVSEFFVDEIGDIRNPVGMTGNRLAVDALIVEGFAPHIDTLVDTVHRAGASVRGVIFSPIASAEGVLSKRQRELGALLIDIGFGTTSFAVYEEGKLVQTGSIPVGAGHITNDITVGLRLPIDVAEKLKLEYGNAAPDTISRKEKISLEELDPAAEGAAEISHRFLSEIIEVRVEEILDWVHNEIDSFGKSIQLPAGAVFVGGGAKLKGLEEFAKAKLKLPASRGFPDAAGFEIMNPSHRARIEDAVYAGAVGLATWEGEEQSAKSVSDLPSFAKRVFRNLIP